MDKSTQIIIPTYNRPNKLFKTLKTYSNLKIKSKLIILDGSDQLYLEINKKNINIVNNIINIIIIKTFYILIEINELNNNNSKHNNKYTKKQYIL